MPAKKPEMDPGEMPPEARRLYETAKDAHAQAFGLVSALRNKALSTGTSAPLGELANVTHAVKQALELVKDLAKELNALQDQYGRLTCVRWVDSQIQAQMRGEKVPDSVRTEYCTATPDVKQIASIPTRKKDPAGFAKLMAYLQVPESLWNVPEEDEVLRPHFPGLVELLTKAAAEGRPLPDGIDPHKTYPQYRLLTRSKKAIDT